MRSLPLAAAVGGALSLAFALPQGGDEENSALGGRVPAELLMDFTHTEAESLDDYWGRTVLIEFFAHW